MTFNLAELFSGRLIIQLNFYWITFNQPGFYNREESPVSYEVKPNYVYPVQDQGTLIEQSS